MEYKTVLAYAPYSDFSRNVFLIGIMNYSPASFCFLFEFAETVEKEPLTDEENEEYKAAKKFFGKTQKEEEEDAYQSRDRPVPKAQAGLNGKGNPFLKDAGSNPFLGYIFSVSGGQHALEWFAKQSAKMPLLVDGHFYQETGKTTIPSDFFKWDPERKKDFLDQHFKEVPLPESYYDRSQEYKNEYLRQYSRHSYEELADILGVKAKRTASKYQPSPKVTDTPDYRGSLPSTRAREREEVTLHSTSRGGGGSPDRTTRGRTGSPSGRRERSGSRGSSSRGSTSGSGRNVPADSSRSVVADSSRNTPTKRIAGIPSSRAQPEEKVSVESVQRAFDLLTRAIVESRSNSEIIKSVNEGAINLLFRSLVESKIEENTQFPTFIYEDKEGKTAKQENGDPEPMFYSGFAGVPSKVDTSVEAEFQAKPAEEYFTAVADPVIVLKLVTRVLNP
jgi:hypothetical protein